MSENERILFETAAVKLSQGQISFKKKHSTDGLKRLRGENQPLTRHRESSGRPDRTKSPLPLAHELRFGVRQFSVVCFNWWLRKASTNNLLRHIIRDHPHDTTFYSSSMDQDDIVSCFTNVIKDDPDMSASVAAVKTLIEIIRVTKVGTLQELRETLLDAITILESTDVNVSSITSGCQLFLRFITLTYMEQPNFKECLEVLLNRGKLFLEKVAVSRETISKLCNPFLRDGATILTHSRSRVVLQVLKAAADDKKRFNVFVSESQPDGSGDETCKELKAMGIPAQVVLDAAVGYVMQKVDLVLVGAEVVVESGGIINKIGTYTIALSAKALNKPVYAVAEFFKFSRLFPLTQEDLPNKFKYQASLQCSSKETRNHPMVDYTPPAYITLLFTDLGVLTPSAVSDELIKLYC